MGQPHLKIFLNNLRCKLYTILPLYGTARLNYMNIYLEDKTFEFISCKGILFGLPDCRFLHYIITKAYQIIYKVNHL